MKMYKNIILVLIFFITTSTFAQQGDFVYHRNLQQFDNRINVIMRHDRIIGLGTQNVGVIITNKTSDELRVKLEYSANLVCGETITKLANGNDGVFLKPGETTDQSSWYDTHNTFFEISINMSSNCRNNKNYRKEIAKNEYTAINSVSYRLISIENVSEKKRQEAAQKEKEEKERKIANFIKQGDNSLAGNNFENAIKNYENALEIDPNNSEAKSKINAAKQKQDAHLAEKKAQQDKIEKEKKEAEEKKKEAEAKAKQHAENTDSKEAKSTNESKSTSSESEESEEQIRARRNQELAEAEAKRREAEEERKRAEEEAKRQRQAEYDQWKSQRQQEQRMYEAEAIASTFGIMTLLGGFIYEGMGNLPNPDNVYKPYLKSSGQFFVSLDIGFSLTSHPLIFASNYTTMRNGSYITEKELQPISAFTLNLQGSFKMGVDSDNYNIYGFITPKVGISPIFNGSNVSPFNYGGHAAAGLKWVKLFAEYGKGGRGFNWSSSDIEDSGTSKLRYNYNKLVYGLKFTTNPNDDYIRNHLFIGIIKETSEGKDDFLESYRFFNPNEARLSMITDKIDGYTFRWKKDHNFDLYINAYPNYWYGGLIDGASGPLNSDFTKDKTGLFIEFGFIRSFDWFISY